MKEKSDSYIVLARKWRPQTFEDVVGQETAKRQLQNALKEGRIANAYLFAGPRGVGKTSIARILAKALNCADGITPNPCNKCVQCVSITQGNSMDVAEIDGASYTGIEDIRDLQEGINRAPFSARKKVYIIDEVHMLSRSAFNALLKTLEEPPPFVVFIFATTELEKIPETIKSRCQMFLFERITAKDIHDRLSLILSREKGVKVSPEEKEAILEAIASSAEGGLRDAEVTLDQLISLSGGQIKFEYVSQLLGLVELDLLIGTVNDLARRDIRSLLERISQLVNKGRDLERFVKTMLAFLRDLMILKAGVELESTAYSAERFKEIKNLLDGVALPFLLNAMNTFFLLEERIKTVPQARFLIEFAFIKLCAIQTDVDIETILSRIEKMDKGIPTPAPRQDYNQPATYYDAPPPPQKAQAADLFNGNASNQPSPRTVQSSIEQIEALQDQSQLINRLNELILQKKPILAATLERAAFRMDNNNLLTISVPEQVLMDIIAQGDTLKLMEQMLSKLSGKPGRIKIELQPLESSPSALISKPAESAVGDSPSAAEPNNAEKENCEYPSSEDTDYLSTPSDDADELEPIHHFDESQYKRLFKDTNYPKKKILELLSQNPDIKSAVDVIKKTLGAKLTHYDDMKIT